MATNSFSFEMSLSGGGQLQDADGAPSYPLASFEVGSTLDELTFTLEDGTGVGQANDLYFSRQTIAAAGSFALNMRGVALFNFMGEAINWTALKGLLVVMLLPAPATKSFTLGPDGGAAPAQAWFSGTGAGQKTTHTHYEFKVDVLGPGWPLVDANDTLFVKNPSAGAIDVDIVAWGCK